MVLGLGKKNGSLLNVRHIYGLGLRLGRLDSGKAPKNSEPSRYSH